MNTTVTHMDHCDFSAFRSQVSAAQAAVASSSDPPCNSDATGPDSWSVFWRSSIGYHAADGHSGGGGAYFCSNFNCSCRAFARVPRGPDPWPRCKAVAFILGDIGAMPDIVCEGEREIHDECNNVEICFDIIALYSSAIPGGRGRGVGIGAGVAGPTHHRRCHPST